MMSFIDIEIDDCIYEIDYIQKEIKRLKIYQWVCFILLCILSINAYYFNSANWVNGIAIGVNITNIIHLFNNLSLSKRELSFYEAKLGIYRELEEIRG